MSRVEWRIEPGLLDYPRAVATMEERATAIYAGTADELIWLVEHPPLYTAGTSAIAAELLDARFPVFAAGRGGRHTYHGPGQRVIYVMLDLNQRGRDIRRFVGALEAWGIEALHGLGIAARAIDGRVGLWTDTAGAEAKIAAIGVRARRWVTFHGMAINGDPDLSHFDGIVPCGLPDFDVTSVAALGGPKTLDPLDQELAASLERFLDRVSGHGSSTMPLEGAIVSV